MVSGVNTQGSTNIQAEAGTVNALAYLRIVRSPIRSSVRTVDYAVSSECHLIIMRSYL